MKLPIMQNHLQNSIGGRAASDQLEIGTLSLDPALCTVVA